MARKGIRAGKAFVELLTDDKLAAGLKAAQAKLKRFGASVKQIGFGLIKAGAAILAPLALGARVHAAFEQEMANVSTMLDNVGRHMGTYTQAVRRMAIDFAESTATLAGGLYDILSASIAPSKALDVLAASARAAKAGLTDTSVAADAITTILNSYGLSADRAADISDLLFMIVKRGKLTFAELAPSIGMVAATASSAGVSLEELGATLATMTRSGVRTERAVTAINAIIMGFIKPTEDAAAAARRYGIELSSTTLQAEGLTGVFDKISGLSPDEIAQIFPNIRALRGVIPALKNIVGYMEDIARMRDRAGATEAAYSKMTGVLMHFYGQAKEAVKGILDALGEAIKKPLIDAAKLITQWSIAIIEVINNNRALVVAGMLVGVAVATLGVAFVGLGVIVGGLSFAFGGLATAASIAGAVIGGIGAVLAALFSPIGLIIAAVAIALGAILYFTGAAGAALDWLKKRFSFLADDALAAFDGIKNALAAGDIKLAAQILWVTLKMEWARGIAWLEDLLIDFRQFFVGVIYGLQAVVTEVVDVIVGAWIDATAALRNAWTSFMEWHEGVTTTWGNWFAKRMMEIQGIFDPEFDVDQAKADLDQYLKAQLGAIKKTAEAARAADKKYYDEKRAAANKAHQEEMANIGRKAGDAEKIFHAERQRNKAANDEELAALKKRQKILQIIALLGAQKAAADAGGPETPPRPRMPKFEEVLAAGRRAIDVTGTFQAAAANRMGIGSTIAQRTAEGVEKLVKLQKDTIGAIEDAAPEFG